MAPSHWRAAQRLAGWQRQTEPGDPPSETWATAAMAAGHLTASALNACCASLTGHS